MDPTVVETVTIIPEIVATPIWWIAAAFGGPSVLVFLFKFLDWFSGMKTNLSVGFTGILGGMEFIDLPFLNLDVTSALVPGFAVAALIANSSKISERKK